MDKLEKQMRNMAKGCIAAIMIEQIDEDMQAAFVQGRMSDISSMLATSMQRNEQFAKVVMMAVMGYRSTSEDAKDYVDSVLQALWLVEAEKEEGKENDD